MLSLFTLSLIALTIIMALQAGLRKEGLKTLWTKCRCFDFVTTELVTSGSVVREKPLFRHISLLSRFKFNAVLMNL